MWSLIESAAGFILKILYQTAGKELTKETEAAFVQFVKFGVVGLSNTLISLFLYTASLLGFKKGGMFGESAYLAAQAVSFVLSVLWSFYWNNKAVFVLEDGKNRSLWRALLKTYVSYSFTGLFLNTILLYFWVRIVHISEFTAPIINLLFSVPVNFMINKFWAFKSE